MKELKRQTGSAVAAIILAAGKGVRFGTQSKLLAPFLGKPVVRHVAESAASSSCDPVIIVTGHQSTAIEAALSGLPLRCIHNASFEKGLSCSLKLGLAALPTDTRAVIVLLGDMPLITFGLIDMLTAAWEENGQPAALVPTFGGQRGNPAVLSRNLMPMIGELSGDTGAGAMLRGIPDVVEWPVADDAVLRDIDLPEQLRALDPERT